MKKISSFSKGLCFILLASIFFTSCDVPDISEFTTASAEMTKNVRLGIKETGGVLDTVSKSNLIEGPSKDILLEETRLYAKKMAPTLKAMNSLDAYLEALNALALANKKSDENAKALIGSVGNLANAVSGVQIPETALKVGTVIVSLFEQFRTARDFKKRVTLVELIVNGATADPDKPCTVENAREIAKTIRNSIDAMDSSVQAGRISIEQRLRLPNGTDIDAAIADITQKEETPTDATDKARLKDLRDGLADIQRIYDNKVNSLDEKEREKLHASFEKNFCGVIDIIKLNIQDLDSVQRAGLKLVYDNTIDDNKILLSFHKEILDNDRRVQETIALILSYKSQREKLKVLSFERDNPIPSLPAADAEKLRKRIKSNESLIVSSINDLAVKDDAIKIYVDQEIKNSDDACNGNVNCPKDEASRNERIRQLKMSPVFITFLENREKDLLKENSRLIVELERIEGQHKIIDDELKAIKNKQKQMNALFESMLSALDTWGETHSNLRLSLNTKKPLSAARLLSRAKEIFEILKPESASTE